MPKSHRKFKGGFLEGVTSSISSGFNSLSQGASDVWSKTKETTKNAYNSATGTPSTTTTYLPTTTTTGGKKKSRKMRGGFTDNTPTTGLASHAAPISDIKNAQPLTIVGGKTKKRRGGKHRHSKSCRHRKHRKH
jgi:hypothetical protein